MKPIAIFYGPEKGSVERVARLMAERIGKERTSLFSVKHSSVKDLERFDYIVFGISTVGRETWEAKGPDPDWDRFLPELDKLDWNGKTVALFGLGDHISYAAYFVDAMGWLGKMLLEKGASVCGQVSSEDYEFSFSDALIDGKFIGLPLDEDFEPEKTSGRIDQWLERILPSFSG